MSSNQTRVWQVAAGDTDRNYVNVCIDKGVILNGPGNYDIWPVAREKMQTAGLSSKKISDIKRFAEDIQPGDWVILRLGKRSIFAVGQVIGPYSWLDSFGDVDGWDLQHARKVHWHEDYRKDPIEKNGIKWGDTTQLVTHKELLDWFTSLGLSPINHLEAYAGVGNLGPISTRIKPQTIPEIGTYLESKGVALHLVDDIKQAIDHLCRLARWYREVESGANGQKGASESEAISHFVFPLLTALGWAPQRISVEWNNVDIALFSELPRSSRTLCTVVEAKKRGSSCLTARSQAESYALKNGSESCNKLIVTDGLRYGVFLKESNGFKDKPSAYLNLLRLMPDYPIHDCGGAAEALFMMSAYA
ncbi:MAG TPA: hypothetical protein VF275_13240 [Gammaproteobacteria bacterium]